MLKVVFNFSDCPIITLPNVTTRLTNCVRWNLMLLILQRHVMQDRWAESWIDDKDVVVAGEEVVVGWDIVDGNIQSHNQKNRLENGQRSNQRAPRRAFSDGKRYWSDSLGYLEPQVFQQCCHTGCTGRMILSRLFARLSEHFCDLRFEQVKG